MFSAIEIYESSILQLHLVRASFLSAAGIPYSRHVSLSPLCRLGNRCRRGSSSTSRYFGCPSIHQVGDESIREVLHSATRLVLGAHALCRIHRLDLVSISHAFGFKSTISHFVGRILTRSDRSIDSKVTSFGHKEHRSHISALGSSNTLGPPVEWHSRALLDHCQAPSARALLHHIRRSIRALCWHDLPPTSGVLTGGIVVGQDIAIRIEEFQALGHRPDKYIPRNSDPSPLFFL